MSKRSLEREDGGDRPPKRSKPYTPPAPPVIEEIHFARQLQQSLIFRQDGIQQSRNGMASFKAFLESILYHRDEDSRASQLSILREYLDTQKPADPKDTEHPFMGQLWQAWSFANQNNNEHLASAVCAIFALLLRTLSTLLDFREHGFLLCRTVLLHQHLRLVKRGLDAPKHKDFVISPCIRLLTEVTSFDGGVLAREVYKRREQTFDISTLRRNLGVVKTE
jgi:nucleolar pre-ribosomal-associated protein 1